MWWRVALDVTVHRTPVGDPGAGIGPAIRSRIGPEAVLVTGLQVKNTLSLQRCLGAFDRLLLDPQVVAFVVPASGVLLPSLRFLAEALASPPLSSSPSPGRPFDARLERGLHVTTPDANLLTVLEGRPLLTATLRTSRVVRLLLARRSRARRDAVLGAWLSNHPMRRPTATAAERPPARDGRSSVADSAVPEPPDPSSGRPDATP